MCAYSLALGKSAYQLETVRRGRVDTAEHVAKSREAIEDSLSLLQRSDNAAAQKPVTRRRPSEGRGPDRVAREKTRPSRSGA
jgi:hypothetical protein